MPTLIEYPTIVAQAVAQFGEVFANEPERRHFAAYLTGLVLAERKTVSGINAEFAVTTDQSCLNRWITEVAWDEGALNTRRLAWLQRDPSTRYARQGVIAIDNTLVTHEGELIADVGWYWDHADQRYVIAHDYLIANYVCPSGKHYALEFRRFRKKEACEVARQELDVARQAGKPPDEKHERLATFKDHTVLFKELVDWVVEREIPGDFAFDCYFTNAAILNHVHGTQRGYVGDLKFNRKVWFQGRALKAEELAGEIPAASRKRVLLGEKKQWYFTKTIHLPEVAHPVRIVILWKGKYDTEACKILVSNRGYWDVTRILRVYRKRWTGTETFHRDGKQELGMGDCQLRKGEGQPRHMVPRDGSTQSADGRVAAGPCA